MIAGYGRLPHQKEGVIALILAVFETLAVVCVDDQSVLKTMSFGSGINTYHKAIISGSMQRSTDRWNTVAIKVRYDTPSSVSVAF